MKCIVCNYENSDDTQFCMGCGRRIPRCPTCNKVLTTRDRFCMNDGTRLSDELLALVPEAELLSPEIPEEVEVEATVAATVQSAMGQTPEHKPVVSNCRRCGAPVPEGAKYCAACRRQMKPQAVCASCGMPCQPGKEYCSYCDPRRPVAADIQYERKPRQQSTPVKKEKKNRTFLVVILVVLLLLLIGVAVGYLAVEMEWIEMPEFLAALDSGSDADRDKDDDDDDVDPEEDDGTEEPGEETGTGSGEDPTGEATQPVTEAPTEKPTEQETQAPTEKPTEAETQPTGSPEAALEAFVNQCDSVYFTRADLDGFTKEMARYARNACYAHGGRKFKDKALQAYYEQYDWYKPTYEPADFDNHYDEVMNTYLRKNLQLIRDYEKEMGFG